MACTFFRKNEKLFINKHLIPSFIICFGVIVKTIVLFVGFVV